MNSTLRYFIIVLLIFVIFLTYFNLYNPLKDKIDITQKTINDKLFLIKEYKNNYQKLTEIKNEISKYVIKKEDIIGQINETIINKNSKLINLKTHTDQNKLFIILKIKGGFNNIVELALELADLQGSPELISMELFKAEDNNSQIIFHTELSFEQGDL